jgi:hypothetical protein
MSDELPPIELLKAADDFVHAMVPRADGGGSIPWWHGWALRDAYIAGFNARSLAEPPSDEEVQRVANDLREWARRDFTDHGYKIPINGIEKSGGYIAADLLERLARQLATAMWHAERDDKDSEVLHARIIELEQQLAAAQQDARRYRWIRARGQTSPFGAQISIANCPDAFDAAIDAAQSAAQEPHLGDST